VAFSKSGDIIPADPSTALSRTITVNNKAIHLGLRAINTTDIRDNILAILLCIKKGKQVAISMRAMSETDKYFVRTENSGLELLDPNSFDQLECRDIRICVGQKRRTRKTLSPLPEAAAQGNETVVKLPPRWKYTSVGRIQAELRLRESIIF
jgi:hypothetical protein